jgi:hypothetical protein
MADNVTVSQGTGTTIAADDIGGVMHQRVKLSLGADGTANDASAGAGVVGTGTQRITLASDDPAVAVLGTISDAAWTSGDGTHDALLKAIAGAALDTTTPSPVAGPVAHDAADSGNPVKIGGKAVADLSSGTNVVANDRTDAKFELDGALLTRGQALSDNIRGLAAITDGSSTSVIAAIGSGIKAYITDVIIANSSATFVTVDLRDGTAGSVLMTLPVPATGGVVHRLQTPLVFTANTAVAADPSAAASTVTVTLLGFKSKI